MMKIWRSQFNNLDKRTKSHKIVNFHPIDHKLNFFTYRVTELVRQKLRSKGQRSRRQNRQFPADSLVVFAGFAYWVTEADCF